MIKKLAKCVREYKRPTVLTLIFIVAEALIETLIPFITAQLINHIHAGAAISDILKTGLILVGMAVASLCCGGIAGFTCANASAGFAKNLRSDIFGKIQTFTFKNIDRFSSASLVTRLTTDVTNVQMSFMMLIRIAIRSPLMFIFSIIMAYYMGGSLAMAFVIVVPILIVGLLLIVKFALPSFRKYSPKSSRLRFV